MLTPAEAFIGVRYIYARRGNHFIAFMSLTAIVATALGVAVLLTILSIMNGFEGELRARILGMAAHVTVRAEGALAADWRTLTADIAARPDVRAAAPYLGRDVLISHRGVVQAIELRGVVPAREQEVSAIAGHMLEGELAELDQGRFRIVIGSELAEAFGLARGDRIALIVPQPLVTPAGMMPRVKRFEVAGIFEFGLHEHDAGLGLIALADAQRLFRAGSAVDGVRAMVTDASQAPAIAAEIAASFNEISPGAVSVSDWTETHRNLFTALKTEKIVMFSILAIAIAIAAFNIVSILVMAVTEKRADIAMLATLGMERSRIMRVFLIQGGLTGAAGIGMGLVAGAMLALNIDVIVATFEQLLGFKILSPDVYYISDIPSELRLPDFLATALVAALLGLAAPIYPAWLAARTEPVEALRYD